MNIKNIAIVRATDVIPFDGIIVPISEAPYISKNLTVDFKFEISDLLKSEGIIPPIDYSRFDDKEYMEEMDTKKEKIIKDYIPYTSTFNSMVLFSLNGLVPDDRENGFGNNTFSNKQCAIIDSLSSHIDEIISLNPVDTAIKGKVKLSKDAVILIEKKTYDSLSIEEKNKLSRFNVILFEGTLKEAVELYLSSSQRYTSEKLSLTSEKKGYLDSPTSEKLKETINEIAEERKISTALHLNILRHITDKNEKLKAVENEAENMIEIRKYYQNEFYKFLFSEMPVEEELQYDLLTSNSTYYIKELCNSIKNFGLENYKNICYKFNYTLELLAKNNILPSPQQIIDSIKKGTPIDLCYIIRMYNQEDNYEMNSPQKNR